MENLLESFLKGDYDESSSDEDQRNKMVQFIAMEHNRMETQRSKRGGSTNGRGYVHRDRVSANERIIREYFAEDPIYPANIFRRRFRMNRPLFLRILHTIQQNDDYFVQKIDAVGKTGLSGLQKMTAAMRILAYGMPADAVDEYVKIGESTAIEALKRFCRVIVHTYEEEYLRSPNEADTSRLLHEGEKRGFPGMLGSLDCMHWEWKNCPTAWHGQFTGHVSKPTIILEAVASYDLWIWHAFFGMAGSHNDINVLDRSPLFSDLTQGRAPAANYTINGHQYNMGYYLADGIYPQWATIVQTISQPQGTKRQLFAKMQESCRKDVERAFGVLQARFAIIKGPGRFWYREDLTYIMKACIVLHNMIVEDERDDFENIDNEAPSSASPVQVSREQTHTFAQFIARYHQIILMGLLSYDTEAIQQQTHERNTTKNKTKISPLYKLQIHSHGLFLSYSFQNQDEGFENLGRSL